MATEVNKAHQRKYVRDHINQLLSKDGALASRFNNVRNFSASVMACEYHITNACNIRCKGCWFFEFGHDRKSKEEKSIESWNDFANNQYKQKINTALLIGGEPSMFPNRVEAFVRNMRYVSVSTNGLTALPNTYSFEKVIVFISLFGGGSLDDDLRAIKPNGKRFTGLFDIALQNYKNDPRATFVFAVSEDGLHHIKSTVEKIRDNGNIVCFNFYSKYSLNNSLPVVNRQRLLSKLLSVKELYRDTVINHPAHLEAMLTGHAWCGEFGFDTCPSISQDHPENFSRLRNGNPTLPFFNTWMADLKTIERCCTSGHCNSCRDSQAVYSWLLVSLNKSIDSLENLRTWVDVAESYWSQFIWSPYHKNSRN